MICKNKKLGFTVIELIIVIAIIAVLSTVIGVYASNYSRKAKIAATQTEVNEIAKAVLLYKANVGCYPNPSTCDESGCDCIEEGTQVITFGSFNNKNFIKNILEKITTPVFAAPPPADGGCSSGHWDCDWGYCNCVPGIGENNCTPNTSCDNGYCPYTHRLGCVDSGGYGMCDCVYGLSENQDGCDDRGDDCTITPSVTSDYCSSWGQGYYATCVLDTPGYVCDCRQGGTEDTCDNLYELCGHWECLDVGDEGNPEYSCQAVMGVGSNTCNNPEEACTPPSSSSSSSSGSGNVNLINMLVNQNILGGKNDVTKDAWGSEYGFVFNFGEEKCSFVYSGGYEGKDKLDIDSCNPSGFIIAPIQ